MTIRTLAGGAACFLVAACASPRSATPDPAAPRADSPGVAILERPMKHSDSLAIEIATLRGLDSLLPPGRIAIDSRRTVGNPGTHGPLNRVARPLAENDALAADTRIIVGDRERVAVCDDDLSGRCSIRGAEALVTLGLPVIAGDSARQFATVTMQGGRLGSFFVRDFRVELVRAGAGWRVTRVELTRIT